MLLRLSPRHELLELLESYRNLPTGCIGYRAIVHSYSYFVVVDKGPLGVFALPSGIEVKVIRETIT